ncbi:alpha/beta fold hydrolase [Phytohabitans flavus]|uniref:Alpha/beta hydrolase n=1 Tax=Phytohabitans flavus TaxID=1076124 RepID=A0A6F8XS61_9ACTN|nr:alpha/beta hydrolase [Phytohabitans flavus]BCB76675.1 alpha/beta hydrolase [Phytohabitans flavus]
MKSRRIRIDGAVTHYLEAGDGPPLVLLHGGEFGAAAEITWERCIPALAAHHRVIAPDFLGYGYSDKLRDMRGQRRRFVAQVAGLLETLCLGPARFVGTSLSARLLLDQAAAESPQWPVEAMVVVGIGLHPPDGAATRALAEYDGTLDGLRPLMKVLFADPAFADDEDYLRRRYTFCEIPGAWEFGAASRLRRPGAGKVRPPVPSARPSYGAISVPTMLVVGEHDALVPAESAAALADAIPGVRSATIAGAGHYPQIERADDFLEATLDFLR